MPFPGGDPRGALRSGCAFFFEVERFELPPSISPLEAALLSPGFFFAARWLSLLPARFDSVPLPALRVDNWDEGSFFLARSRVMPAGAGAPGPGASESLLLDIVRRWSTALAAFARRGAQQFG